MSISTPGRVPVPARLGLGLAAALLAAACGSSASTGSAPPPSGSPAAGGSGTVIKTASVKGSTFLTDGTGKAVYLWVKDGNDQSACSGSCIGAWPVVAATGTVTASGGAQSSDLGTLTRPDGTKQVTYKGHPLYYYVGDSGPGMASGQNSDSFGAKWWLVSPSGADVTGAITTFTAASPGSSPTSKPAGGGS